jgi:hypothetical protein
MIDTHGFIEGAALVLGAFTLIKYPGVMGVIALITMAVVTTLYVTHAIHANVNKGGLVKR